MTNPTPHGQVPAIRRYKIGYYSDEWGQRSSTPSGIPDASGSWVRYEDHAAELRRLHAYCQELESQVIRDCMTHVQNPAEIEHVVGEVSKNSAKKNMNVYAELSSSVGDYKYGGGLYTDAQMRDFADRTHALRAASHGQAPAQAGEYPALVCDYCGALTPDPWHSSGMLHGKMSKHIHSCDACAARGAAEAQAADSVPVPPPPPECETEAEKRAFAFGWFKALESERMKAESVREDAARLDWLDQNLFHREKDEWDTKFGGYKEYNMWVLFSPKGIQGRARDIIDAARKQGATP